MHEVAEKFLDQAEQLVEKQDSQERLLSTLEQAERLFPDSGDVLCRSSQLLFRYGILNGKGGFLFLALDKIKLAEERDPDFFKTSYIWWQLWGNILVQIGKKVGAPTFYEAAIEKYGYAAKIAQQTAYDLEWDVAEAWALLGHESGEMTDFQKALAKFSKGQNEYFRSAYFRIDHGKALVAYGNLIGNPDVVDEALSFFRGVIADTYYPGEELPVAYGESWRQLALAMKARYFLSFREDHFQEADISFREAILATTSNKELWLDWGHLYLWAGWVKKDVKLVEAAIEKLTSSKIKECDPLRASALIGLGLTIFGSFLENLKLLTEGKERIEAALAIAPQEHYLLFALGFAYLGNGIYFSDEKALAKAISLFEERLQEDSTSAEVWHSLFQAYCTRGTLKNDPSLANKGIQAIARLCEIRPFSTLHLNEWGVALLRIRQLENNREQCIAYIDEAIDKFRRASQISEDDETLYNWGCALDLLGDMTADEEDYAKAIELLTKVFEKQSSEAHVRYHLGLAFSHLGELVSSADCLMQAADLFESVTKVDQEDPILWCDWGYTVLNLSVIIYDPVHPEHGENLRREAERILLHAAELGSGDACYHAACLYSLCGLYNAAMHYLRKAQQLDSLPSREDLEHDEWLAGLQEIPEFQEFLFSQDKNG